MIQTGLIQNVHDDLLTDVSYDFYGLHFATCSLDQKIKIWSLDESTGIWSVEDEWKAHDAAISKVSWAHPEFGTILASASFDRTVKIWEQMTYTATTELQPNTSSASQQASGGSSSRWSERAALVDARGTVRAVEFAPHHFGLKLATISTDNHLRIYECLEQSSLTTWQLSEEVDVTSLPVASRPSSHSVAFGTPTHTNATLDGASASLVAQALQQSQGSLQGRGGLGNREADGGWCISWCKERYWGEVIAAGSGTSGTIKIVQISPSRRPTTLLTLDPSPTGKSLAEGNTTGAVPGESDAPAPYAVTTVAWAPSCGRSYHLIATGSRDGHVRIWKVKPAEEGDMEDDSGGSKWTASIAADFDNHRSAVGRVEWNITGTVLSSAGNDGRVRLWKATVGGVWRSAGSIGVEQTEEEDAGMDENAAAAD
ncbi:WD40-repeat-containing domain protein [Pisolithus croceorrhizus]|nr:WD40-repeat-containing domain protein [Pisolithus croceorrhizus]KAI6127945.1 WD40-repeat-containing domain protein [Pisolithus croceorrhizus]KAI6158551.1 WD40-repeat-containing domain protein [Pisolithus thermaeus]